jgi:hypothetical protein
MSSVLPTAGRPDRRRAGQSLIESCIVIFLSGLLLGGLFQLSQILAAREILEYAAACGARAKTVGFNQWMVEKVVRVAGVPNAGKLLRPEFENEDPWLREQVAHLQPGPLWARLLAARPGSRQYELERARIPEYLDSHHPARARHVLDYADWDTIRYTVEASPASGSGAGLASELLLETDQEFPLRTPAHRSFYAADALPLRAEAALENHYPLYMQDEWL